MPNTSFLEKLLLKLKSSDARSIHLNALPSNYARIDIFDFVNINQSLHLQFLHQLFTQKKINFSITIDNNTLSQKNDEELKILNLLIKKLNNLYFEEKESEQEHGYHSFGFGYPLLIKKDKTNNDKIIKAPIFIWYLSIEKDLNKKNTWIISRDDNFPVVVNPALLSYLENTENILFKELEETLDDEIISEDELLHFVGSLMEKIGEKLNHDNIMATILPCTNKESIEILTKDVPWVRFSGVFGLYKTMKQSIINDIESIIESNGLENIYHSTSNIENKNTIATNILDDTQEEILFALNKHEKIIIQGPPGTGKSQTLTGIIANALLNEKKVLVVCEKKTALEVIQQNLGKLSLSNLSVLIEDVYADRRNIVEKIRAYIEEEMEQKTKFRQHEYHETECNFLAKREKINTAINATQSIIFGDDNILDLILTTENLEKEIDEQEIKLIQQEINNSLFDFSYTEYIEIKKEIIQLEKLFKNAEAVELYNQINIELIRDNDDAFIENKIITHYQNAVEIANAIQQNKLHKAYNTLQGIYVIIYQFVSIFSGSIRKYILNQKNNLGSINSFFECWNTNPIFIGAIQKNELRATMSDYEPSLHSIITKIQPLVDNIKYFKNYYLYKKYFINSEKKIQHIVALFEKKINNNWENNYRYWYLKQFISNYIFEKSIHELTQDSTNKLKKYDEQIKQTITAKINFTWEAKKQNNIKNKDLSNLKYLYNLRKNKQFESKNTLRKIIQNDIDFFTDFFPVVLTNPSVCASIFPAKPHFDIIILDEASQLKIEDTYSSLLRAKQHIISGDKHQMPPSNFFGNTPIFWSEESEHENSDFLAESQSLLEFADDAGYKNYYIDFHYRSKHPDLIQFSNHAFYQSRLIPMPTTQNYTAIEYYDVNGVYDSGTNLTEAEKIIEYLYHIDISHHVPSIGIATFNIYQRDLILNLLYEKSNESSHKSKHLEALLANKLFVKNLENIQGDERDLLILSTTFGKNKEGKFRQSFGPLSQEKGYKLLNVIITRAKEKVIIFSSIPNDYIQQYHEEIKGKGNTGKAILYAYLAYAKNVSEGNVQQKHFILNQLQSIQNRQPIPIHNEKYIQYLYNELKICFNEQIEYNYIFGGILLPIVFIKNEKIKVYLHLLDINKNTKETNYRKYLHLEKILNNYNINTISISSYEWLTERKKLIETIKNLLD